MTEKDAKKTRGVRLNDSEWNLIQERAAAVGEAPSEWIRNLLLTVLHDDLPLTNREQRDLGKSIEMTLLLTQYLLPVHVRGQLWKIIEQEVSPRMFPGHPLPHTEDEIAEADAHLAAMGNVPDADEESEPGRDGGSEP